MNGHLRYLKCICNIHVDRRVYNLYELMLLIQLYRKEQRLLLLTVFIMIHHHT